MIYIFRVKHLTTVVCVLFPSAGKKASRKLSDVEEEDEEDEGELPDFEGEEEGEKENEDLCNEGGTPVSKPKRKRKRKNEKETTTEEQGTNGESSLCINMFMTTKTW